MKKDYILEDSDELILNGKQLREWKFYLERNMIKRIKRYMVKGHDDFQYSYCIDIEDWNKIGHKLKQIKGLIPSGDFK